MALYLISYDINEKDAFEYDALWAHLKEIGAVKILYSEWLIKGATGTSCDIYGNMAPFIQAKDRLLVQEVTLDAAWDKLLISDSAFKQLVKSARG
jgi:hypothetical protein